MQRLVWKHFALVAVIVVLYESVNWIDTLKSFPQGPAGLPWDYLILHWIWYYIGTLPAVAAIALSLIELRPGWLRTVLPMIGAVLLLMIAFDVWGTPRHNRLEERLASGWDAAPRLDDTTGVLQRTVALLRGQVKPEDIQTWPPTQAPNSGFVPITNGAVVVRLEATRTARELQPFLMPFIVTGLVLGMVGWLTRHAQFPRLRDARALRIVGAWVLVFFVQTYVGRWMDFESYYVAAKGGTILWLYARAVPATLVGALGWRVAAQTAKGAVA